MRKMGEHYTQTYHAADLSVIGSMGIDSETKTAISKISGASCIEYGYLKDVVLADTDFSVRVFSNTKSISQYEVVQGRMPETNSEIALSNDMNTDYAIGDTISFTEKADLSGDKVLKEHAYAIVGFVHSTELLSQVHIGMAFRFHGLNSTSIHWSL